MQVLPKLIASLEQKQRLSRSVLWKLQRNYFERQGIAAWSAGSVPHHITSSPFIADAYAKIVFGFVRDLQGSAAQDRTSGFTPLDANHPVYIVELGSGSGRFAYLLLKEFLAHRANSALSNISIKYVMTDFAAQNLAYWRAHPSLQSFIGKGLLDFARFDLEHDRKLKLVHSGEVLSSNDLRNPLVVIANYLFDSIPQDAFFAAQNELFETLVTLTTPEKEPDLEDPEILSRVEILYDHKRINGHYYRDAKWNQILRDYKERLTDTAFLFPTAALRCVRNLHRLSRGRMLLLSGDRGYSSDEALKAGQGEPAIATHGSISLMVDYQIIGEYCRNLGGQVLHPGRRAESLNISAFMFGALRANFSETRAAYLEAIEKFGPDDFFTLKEGIAQVYDTLSLDQILAFLRLSCWDYKRFWECLPTLKKHLPEISDSQKQQLHEAIVKVWDAYLPIGEENDLAFELGTLLLEMEFFNEAREFLQHSVDVYGLAPGTAYNLGVCCYGLGQMQPALEYVNSALELDSEFAEAMTLHTELSAVIPSVSLKPRRRRRA